MTMLTPDGRYDRAAVVDRAKRIMATSGDWAEAMRRAYAEASLERKRSQDGRTNMRCQALAKEADRLIAAENEL